MQERKTDKTERRNKQTHNYGWRFQHSFLSNRVSIQKKKISKNVEELSNPVNLFYIIDIYRHYSKISECVF